MSNFRFKIVFNSDSIKEGKGHVHTSSTCASLGLSCNRTSEFHPGLLSKGADRGMATKHKLLGLPTPFATSTFLKMLLLSEGLISKLFLYQGVEIVEQAMTFAEC